MNTLKSSPRESEATWRRRMLSIRSEVEDLVLPDLRGAEVPQGEEWAEIVVRGEKRSIRYHDYPDIFNIPGLYEEIFYERLACDSPWRIAHLLQEVLAGYGVPLSGLRILDVGAGNGMVGDELKALGAQHIVGVDVLEEARNATLRDRPDVYADYVVADLDKLPGKAEAQLRAERFNCLTMVAAMGVQDIQSGTLVKGLDLLEAPGWAAFTVREDILKAGHASG
ncbi:MAG: class I SAM-dependent methyltransferase, partial [Dehalococcoidia bacterium]